MKHLLIIGIQWLSQMMWYIIWGILPWRVGKELETLSHISMGISLLWVITIIFNLLFTLAQVLKLLFTKALLSTITWCCRTYLQQGNIFLINMFIFLVIFTTSALTLKTCQIVCAFVVIGLIFFLFRSDDVRN